MSVSANNDVVIRQSKQSHPYFSGSPQFIEATFINIKPQAGTEKRVGTFSTIGAASPYNTNRDGLYIYADATNLYFKIDKG